MLSSSGKSAGKGGKGKLIFKIAPVGIWVGIRAQQEEVIFPVRPIFKKELNHTVKIWV